MRRLDGVLCPEVSCLRLRIILYYCEQNGKLRSGAVCLGHARINLITLLKIEEEEINSLIWLVWHTWHGTSPQEEQKWHSHILVFE